MSINMSRNVFAILVVVAVLVGGGLGLLVGRMVLRSRPTCENAVNNWFALMPERQRGALELMGFNRDAEVRNCREGRWSPRMKSCFMSSTSLSDIDTCPHEWLNAPAICAQIKREVDKVEKRCQAKPPWTLPKCADVKAIAPGARNCIEYIRTLDCGDLDEPVELCEQVMGN